MTTKEVVESNLNLVISMYEQGKTEKEIAEAIGVSYASWKRFKAQSDTLKAQLKELKAKRVKTVEESLFKVATGYHYYEEVPTKVKEEVLADDGQTILTKESVVLSKVKKYRGADFNAIKYFLTNRNNKDWKENPDKTKIDKETLKLKKKEFDNNMLNI